MPSRYARRATLVLGGFAAGLLVVLLLVYVYFRVVTSSHLAEAVVRAIDLPAEVMSVEALEGDSIARVALRDVALRDRDGASIASAPVVRLTIDLKSLAGTGPIELREVLVSQPSVDFVQYADGTSNFSDVAVVTAGGKPVATGENASRGVVIRDLRIAGGDVRWASPYQPDSLGARPGAGVRLERLGGTLMRVRSVHDLALWAPVVETGGSGGWRVEVAAASARLTDPEIRVLALAGSAESTAPGAVRFAVNTFRTDDSSLTAEGVVRLGGPALEYEVSVHAAPLALGDLRWFSPAVPAGGRAEGNFALASLPNGQVQLSAGDLVVTAFDSRITGRFSAWVGGGQPAAFWDTRLALDPLRLETLQQLGLVADLPYTGEVRGTVGSDAATAGAASALAIDLTANFTLRGSDVPTSTVFLRGPVTVGGAGGVELGGVEVALQPLHLAALRPYAPGQEARLRGTVRGTAVLRGTPDALQLRNGDLAYEVGTASRTRLTGLALDLGMKPEVRFTLDARAEPLALGTFAELFPAFPFRTATFAGPIHLEGTTKEFRIDTELSGAAGLIAVRGSVAPGDGMRFDLSGRVSAFNTQVVMDRPGPLEGPVSGTFSAAGTPEQLRFNVDLAQLATDTTQAVGSFTLAGTFRRVAGEALVDVAGKVVNFNLGALIGRPALFPSRMTGAVQLAGGGREPYRFDVNLAGASGALALRGSYATGAVPAYQVTGTVAGLNLRQLPGGESLPPTDLNATLDVQGAGTTLETLAGDFHVNASRSTIAGRPLEALRADVSVRDGVATFDTLVVALANTRLTAAGTWGLTRPVATPLTFRLASSDLSSLAPFLPPVQGVPPQMGGTFTLQGTVAGSMRLPVVDVVFSGGDLRYEGWRARQLDFGLAATLGRRIEELNGDLTLNASGLDLAGRASLASVHLGLEGGGAQVAVRLAVDRDARTSVALAGLLEMRGSTPAGLLLDSLTVRSGTTAAWELTTPARLRYGGADGLVVSNLNLQRTGGAPGSIAIDGAIPPSGVADLRVAVENFDLALAQQLVPTAPALQGLVRLDAVLRGPVADPELSLNGTVTKLQYRDVAADSVSLTGRYAGRLFTANAAVRVGGSDLALAEATVPMQLSFANATPSFELLRDEPVRARVVADSLPIALFASSVPTVENPDGTVSAEMTAGGSIARPELQGWARVQEGAATFTDLGVRYTGINGRVSFDGSVVRVDSLVLRSAGTATASGTIRLVDLKTPEVFLTAQMQGFRAIQNKQVADLTLSGNVALSGRMPRPVLTGRVVVDEGVIYLPNLGQVAPVDLTAIDIGDINPDTALAVAVGPGFVQNVQVSDLNVVLNAGVWMEAPTARVEIRGELVVYRSGTDLRLYGNLAAVRGTYALTIGPIVRQFDVTGGSVRFLGTADLNPELDITAAHQIRSGAGAGGQSNLTIVVRVTGTAEYPRVTLTSDTQPPLPESELLNYLVFGQPSFRLSQQQSFAQQVVVQEVLGGILMQGLGQLGLPCQYLRLRGTETMVGSPLARLGSTSLECGVQLLRDLFLTLETGVTSAVNQSNPFNALLGVSLDWQVANYLAARLAREPVRTSAGPLFQSRDVPYQWSADVNGTWEFGKPDTSKIIRPDVPETRLPGVVAPAPPPAPAQPPAPPGEPPAAAPATPAAAPARREGSASPR